MTTWAAFYPDLLPAAPGCPDPLLERETRRSAIEFLRRTRVWVEWLDPVKSVEGLTEYDLDLPSGADVVRVERATIDGKTLAVTSYRDAKTDWTRHESMDKGLISQDRKTFRIGSAVAAGLPIQVQVALIPSRTSSGIPDDLFDRYGTEIAAGALSMVLMNAAFYNPELAMLKRALFDSAIAAISVDAWRGHTASTPRSRVRFC